MNDSQFGLTNFYLKAGVVLISVAALVFLTGFVRSGVPSAEFRGPIAAVLGTGGAVLYIIGRIIKARRA